MHWFIGDERFVPATDPLNNMAMARAIFLDRCAPAANIHPIPTATADPADPDRSAALYEQELKSFYGADALDHAHPLFDLVLMGVGPDGHTASLFPGDAALDETARWAVGVPKANVEPFVPRVTLTLPTLASCREMLFEVAGADKRAILTRLLAGENLPANRARSTGETIWLVDRSALPENFRGQSNALRAGGDGRLRLGQEHRFRKPRRTARLGLRGRRQVSPGQQCRQDERRPSAHRRGPLAVAAGHCRRDRPPLASGARAVIACSALKRAYRDILVHGRDDVRIVFLDGTQDLIADRLAARKGHFMPPDLLASQFRTLERPGANERPIIVSIDAPVEQIVDDIVSQLNLVSQ